MGATAMAGAVAAISAVHASSVNRGGGRGAVGWPGQLAGPRPRGGEVLSFFNVFFYSFLFIIFPFYFIIILAY